MKNEVDINIEGLIEFTKELINSGELENFICPDCGKEIEITGLENKCECGFVLTLNVSDPEY